MKQYHIPIFLLILLTIGACASNKPYQLTDNKSVSAIFNKDEVAYLSKILYYFDSLVMQSVDIHNPNEAYQDFFYEIKQTESIAKLDSLFFKHQKWLQGLFIDQLRDDDNFNDIWNVSFNFNDTTLPFFRINMKGKYFSLLELRAQNSSLIHEYVENAKSTGINTGPSSVALFLYKYTQMDFKNELDRLIWAIHYITLMTKVNAAPPPGYIPANK